MRYVISAISNFDNSSVYWRGGCDYCTHWGDAASFATEHDAKVTAIALAAAGILSKSDGNGPLAFGPTVIVCGRAPGN